MKKAQIKNTLQKEITAANVVTLLRLVLVPFIMHSLLQEKRILTIIFLVIALLSDAVDGYLARKFQETSEFGKRFDQFVDKILLLSIIFALLWNYDSLLWTAVYAGVSIIGIFLGVLIVKKNLYVTTVNKIAMWFQSLLLLVMILGYTNTITLTLFLLLLLIPAGDYMYKILQLSSSPTQTKQQRAFFVDKKKHL